MSDKKGKCEECKCSYDYDKWKGHCPVCGSQLILEEKDE